MAFFFSMTRPDAAELNHPQTFIRNHPFKKGSTHISAARNAIVCSRMRPPSPLLLLALVAACAREMPLVIPSATATLGELTLELDFRGTLASKNVTPIATPAIIHSKPIIHWMTEEGTNVVAGDVLMKLERGQAETTLASALERSEVLQTELRQQREILSLQLSDLQNKVRQVEIGVTRAYKQQTRSEAVPLLRRRTAELDFASQTMSLEAASNELAAAELKGQATLTLKQLTLKDQEELIEQLERDLDLLTIRASTTGYFVLLEGWHSGKYGKVGVGDVLDPFNDFAEIQDPSKLEVTTELRERDAAQVAQGQTIQLVLEAHPGRTYTGVVRKVGELALKRRRERIKRVQLVIDLDELTPETKPTMSVRGTIACLNERNVLLIPREAVFDDGSVVWAYTSTSAGWRRTPIDLGEKNDTHVIVEGGLEPGDIVALVAPEATEP